MCHGIRHVKAECLRQTGLEGGGGFLNTFLDALDGSYCSFSACKSTEKSDPSLTRVTEPLAVGETGDASIDPVYPDPNPVGYEGQRQCGVYKPVRLS